MTDTEQKFEAAKARYTTALEIRDQAHVARTQAERTWSLADEYLNTADEELYLAREALAKSPRGVCP